MQHLKASIIIRPCTKGVFSQGPILFISEKIGMKFSPKVLKEGLWQLLVVCQRIKRHALSVAGV